MFSNNIVVYKILVLYILQINVLDCTPPALNDKIQKVNMEDTKERKMILELFNMTDEEFNRKQHEIIYNITSNKAATPETFTDGADFEKIQLRRNHIIDQVIGLRNETITATATSTKIYPICTSSNNDQSWHNDYNQTIRFGESSLNLNIYENPIETALLRMYKIPVEDSLVQALDICNSKFYYRQIRVSISIYVQSQSDSKRQRDRKKILVSTTMLPYVYEGWIEMEVQRAIYTWKTTNSTNNFRILLEVHDEENYPLKPGNFFMPMRCLTRSNSNMKRYYPSKEIQIEDGQFLYIKIEHEKNCAMEP